MNNNYFNRRSIRLSGYDYSQQGTYFITICTYNREPLFGIIENDEMILNEVGLIARNYWLKTEQIRPNIILGEFVVMPNHFHAIFSINGRGVLHTPSANLSASLPMGLSSMGVCNTPLQGPSQTVGAIVRGYKSAVSKHIGQTIWQRNYHEHIIRTPMALDRITQYIISNPQRWTDDCFFQ